MRFLILTLLIFTPLTTLAADAQAADAIHLEQELGAVDGSQEQSERLRIYKREDGATIEEFGSHGRVYMIRVKPDVNLPAYYLYDSDGDGTFERRLADGSKRPSPPMWVIKRF